MTILKDLKDYFPGIIFVGLIIFRLGFEKISALGKSTYQLFIRALVICLILLSLGLRRILTILKSIPGAIKQIFLVGIQILKSILKWTIIFGKNVPRISNWIFTIGFTVFGIVLLENFVTAGVALIIAGILISPFVKEILPKSIQIYLSLSNKTIIALLAIFTVVVNTLYFETDEKRFLAGFLLQNAWLSHDDEQISQLQGYFANEKLKQQKQEYLTKRELLLTELKDLFTGDHYQKVIDIGTPYLKFNTQIAQWVSESQKILKQQLAENARQQAPKLLKEGKYKEAYQLAKSFDTPELQKVATKAKKQIDKKIAKLKSWYEQGNYKKVIKKGQFNLELDCRVEKLINDAQEAQAKAEERRRLKRTIKKVSKLIRTRRYSKAIKFATQSKYVDRPEIQKLIRQAKFQRKKKREKRILAKLRNIPTDFVELNIREYSKLVELFPDNEKYQRKLTRYKKKLLELRKRPSLHVTQKDFGDKWPFTVSEGELECLPPGIVIFKVNEQTYAANGLAGSRGYKSIDVIWKDDQEKISKGEAFTKVNLSNIINKGLELCNNH